MKNRWVYEVWVLDRESDNIKKMWIWTRNSSLKKAQEFVDYQTALNPGIQLLICKELVH